MSRAIPRDEALSHDDRRYLLERGQESTIAYIDQQYPPDPEDLAEFDAMMRGEVPPDYTGDRGFILGLQARVEQLETYIREDLNAEVPLAPGETPAESDDRPYSDWSKDELKAEAEARQLSTSGTKPELVQRLTDSDAASA